MNLTILFISHDLPVVRQMCDRIGVLKDGKLCEVSNTEELFINADNEFKCPVCGSNVKVNINVSPILQTDVLADNIQTSLESVTTEAEATA